jgi:hypothetical protein
MLTDLIQSLPSNPKGSAKRDDSTSTRQNTPHTNTQAVVPASSGATVNPFAPLPDELILEICEQLLPAEDSGCDDAWDAQFTFASLALTCQYLHPFGMRYLYRTYRAMTYQPRNNFLTTAYASGDLIHNVREIIISKSSWPRKSSPRMAVGFLITQIMALAGPYKEQWLDMCKSNPDHVALALMIFCSRKALRLLELSSCPIQLDTLFLDFLSEATGQLSVAPSSKGSDFGRLRELKIDMTHVPYEGVLRVFLLPSLDTVYLLNCNAVASSEDKSSPCLLAQGCSNVENIYLTSCTIPSSVLARMIRACKALESFCYVNSDIPETSEAIKWYEELFEAMITHQDTLEELMLDAWEDTYPQWSPRYACLEVLVKMKALQSLYIAYAILMGKPSGQYEIEDSARVPDATWPGYTPNCGPTTAEFDQFAIVLQESSAYLGH